MSTKVEIGFDRKRLDVPLDKLAPTKVVPTTVKKSIKYNQILSSVREVGIVEPLVIHRITGQRGNYALLDGHLRLEVLKELKQAIAPCLLARDDESFTYNKRINRLSSVQEHYMILRAVKNGVSEDRIAAVLNVDVKRIRQKRQLLDGICDEAIEILKDKNFSSGTAKVLKQMKPLRQIEMAELMAASNNYSIPYAKALLAATPDAQLNQPSKKGPIKALSLAEQETMQQELENIQRDIKSVEDEYGPNMLNLVVANGYLDRLLENDKVAGYLRRNHRELHVQLEAIHESIASDIGIHPLK